VCKYYLSLCGEGGDEWKNFEEKNYSSVIMQCSDQSSDPLGGSGQKN